MAVKRKHTETGILNRISSVLSPYNFLKLPVVWVAFVAVFFLFTLRLNPVNIFPNASDYVAAHTVMELISIIVSMLVFVLAWYLRSRMYNNRIMLIGAGSLTVALLDLMHALSFPGSPQFLVANTTDRTIDYWLAARFIAAVTLLLIAVLPQRHWRQRTWFILLAGAAIVVSVVFWIGTYRQDILPLMYIDGQGLTPLKINIEYALACFYMLIALICLYKSVKEKNTEYAWIAAATIILSLSEVYLTLYNVATDIFNFLGHVYKIIAYIMIYRAIFVAGIREPFEELNAERSTIRALIDSLPDIIYFKDNKEKYIGVNHAYTNYSGKREEEMIGKEDSEISLPGLTQQRTTQDREVIIKGITQRHEDIIVDLNGRETILDVIKTPIVGTNGETLGMVGVARDISEQMHAQAQINQLVYYDPLTKLPNKTYLLDKIQQEIATAEYENGQSVALSIIDIDNFKAINDALGRKAGDLVLQEIASKMKQNLDSETVLAHIQGDSYAILIPGVSPEKAFEITERVTEVMRKPISVNNLEIVVAVSAGIALFPQDGSDYETLFNHAEAAMYSAKEEGKNTTNLFNRDLQDKVVEKAQMLQELRRAIDKNEFCLYYQPQLSIATNECVGLEALIRWQHPTKGLLSPYAFIPLAEETDLIAEIGKWVGKEAIRQTRKWLDDDLIKGKVSINISMKRFTSSQFPDMIKKTLEEHDLPARFFGVELTEASAMSNPNISISHIHQLREMGVHVAIDDFGTGYSSMNYLTQLNISCLKIDKSFIDNVTTNHNSAAIVKAIIQMAKTLGYETIAEGVETEGQYEFLKEHECDIIQGFYFSKPLSPTEVERFLTMRKNKQ